MSELPGGVEPAEPPVPKDSALGVLLRRSSRGNWQVLLGVRSRKARFLPGSLAFPGGGMEPEDRSGEAEEASWRRCATREVREETGIEIPVERWLDGGERITPPIFPVRFRTRFLAAGLPDGDGRPAPLPATSENEELLWADPGETVDQFRAGTVRSSPPVLAVLRALHSEPPPDLAGAAAVLRRANREQEDLPRIEFIPGIRCLPVRTDTLPPATHTNVWLPLGERMAVIDPGSSRDEENRRLLRCVRTVAGETGAAPSMVLLTHHHQDHVSGAGPIARALEVPVRAHRKVLRRIAPLLKGVETVPLEDGETVRLGGLSLRPVLTEGHAEGHLAFHVPERKVLISGDLVSALSTMVIDPAPGTMDAYLASLRKASEVGALRLLPSHGPPVPASLLEKTARHREAREQTILDLLPAAGSGSGIETEELAEKAYRDTPGALRFLAARQTLAHLFRLQEAGSARPAAGKPEAWERAES